MIGKMLSLLNYLVITVVSFSVKGVLTQLYKGDPCTTSNGIWGICNYHNQCQSARDDIRDGIFPKICDFEGTKPIVCCTDSVPQYLISTVVTTTEPTSTKGKVGARAVEMCKQYTQYANEISQDPSMSITSTVCNNPGCSLKKEAFIVGGTKASRQEFPHMAQLGYKSDSQIHWGACGGSLISINFILTAAHCLWSPSLGFPKLVRVGITNITDTNYLQVRNVQLIIKHPDYTGEKYHDIALLKMDRDFEMSPYVRPACVYTEKNIPYQHAMASGWGSMKFSGNNSRVLLKVVLEFFSTAQCNHTYQRDIIQPDSKLSLGIVEDLMICAGSSKALRDTCQGDSGGPLQVYHEDTDDIKCVYNIVGVTSFGLSCGLAKNVPGVYTRVSSYVKWIEDNVWPI